MLSIRMMSDKIAIVCTTLLAFSLSTSSFGSDNYDSLRNNFITVVDGALKYSLETTLKTLNRRLPLFRKQNKLRIYIHEQATNFLSDHATRLKDVVSDFIDMVTDLEGQDDFSKGNKIFALAKINFFTTLAEKKTFIQNLANRQNEIIKKFRLRPQTFTSLMKKLERVFNFTNEYDHIISVSFSRIIDEFETKHRSMEIERKQHLIRTQVINEIQDIKKTSGEPPLYSIYISDNVAMDNPLPGDENIENLDEDTNECSVCFSLGEKITLPCSHSFCSECIAAHIAVKISENSDRIKCLALNCKADLVLEKQLHFKLPYGQENDLSRNILETEIARYKDRYLKCSNSDCSFVYCNNLSIDENERQYKRCRYCKTRTCLKCRSQHGKNHICSEALFKQREDERQIRLEGKFMDCPYCGTWHEKIDGCSKVHCKNKKCYRAFDFATGGPWGKASEMRQRGRHWAFHPAEAVDETALIKSKDDYVDGKNQW
jgi:hypothetical protein